VLLAAHGAGAAVCEETPVVRDDGHCWSLLQRRREPFYVGCASACLAEGRPLPHDLKTLHERAGLESFLSVLIAAGGTVLGSLTIAATAPDAFDEAWWQPVLTMAASALLPHLRNRQVRLLLGWLGGRAVGWDGWICMGGCGVSMHVLATVLLPADTDSCWHSPLNPACCNPPPQLVNLCRMLVSVDAEQDAAEVASLVIYVS
jgi:hypothetical protein